MKSYNLFQFLYIKTLKMNLYLLKFYLRYLLKCYEFPFYLWMFIVNSLTDARFLISVFFQMNVKLSLPILLFIKSRFVSRIKHNKPWIRSYVGVNDRAQLWWSWNCFAPLNIKMNQLSNVRIQKISCLYIDKILEVIHIKRNCQNEK